MAEPVSEKDMEEAEIVDETPNDDTDYEPLFENEREEPTEKETADSEPKGESKGLEQEEKAEEKEEPEPEKAESEKKEPEEEKEPEKDEKPKKPEKDDKPPPNFVPSYRLKQETQKRQTLEAEVKTLRAELAKAKTTPVEGDRFEKFEVKSSKEFRELQEEDPDVAAAYLYEYNQYIEHRREKDRQETAEKQAKEADRILIQEGAYEVGKVLPGFYEENDAETQKVATFAVDNGISPDILFDLTNPATRLTSSKGDQYVLGTGAAQVVKLIKDFALLPDEDSLREQVEKELRKKIEEELKGEVLEKIKKDEKFQTLDSTTTSSEKKASQSRGLMTEAEWAKLPDEDRRQLLGG